MAKTAVIQKEYASLFYKYVNYNKSIKPNSQKYVSGGIKIVMQLDSVKAIVNKNTITFISENQTSPVATFVAKKYLYRFTTAEIKIIYNMLLRNQKNNPELIELAAKIEIYNKCNVGAAFSDYTLQDTSGKSVKLSSFIGKNNKYILLEFWASWCNPCRQDFPHLKTAYNLYKSSGFEVIGISIDSDKKKWKKALKEDGNPWIQLINPQGLYGDLMTLYNFNSVPTSILIGPDETIVNLNMRESWLDNKLISLFGNKFGALY
ncbi:peroxiredoxin [Mucilaginibacter gracilis]|uniref:Peroxiredoxin n=1 Tax=Mucilaginibacter gracilis TaxID=423350 RepID=A0A495IZD4_9SPHI|nr:TlpA family protein disulfide reductase [Mucilaginibacter gracilis]RKR82047.1 peroxiredoxin [Mucilaginibacter gracilis]